MATIEPSQFIGGWHLLDWSVSILGEEWHRPYGENPSGNLIYAGNGVMSATFMAEKRRELGIARPELPVQVSQAVAAIKTGRLDPLARAYFFSAITFTGYCGTYSVEAKKVIHHVETALIQDWVGIDLVRTFEFDGNCLILTAEENDVVDKLIWQRQ